MAGSPGGPAVGLASLLPSSAAASTQASEGEAEGEHAGMQAKGGAGRDGGDAAAEAGAEPAPPVVAMVAAAMGAPASAQATVDAARAVAARDFEPVAKAISEQVLKHAHVGDAEHASVDLRSFLDPAKGGRIGPARDAAEKALDGAAPAGFGHARIAFSRHATLNPNAASGTAGHPGATLGDVESASNFCSWKANACVRSGKWQYEVCLRTCGIQQIGWVTDACSFTHEEGVGDASDSYAFDGKRVKKWNVASQPYGQRWECGDVIGCVMDVDNGTVAFYRNGEALGTAFASVRHSQPMLAYYPALSLSQGERSEVNVGERPFLYPVAGYAPLSYPPSDGTCKLAMRLLLRICALARWRDAMPDHATALAHLAAAPLMRMLTERREGAYLVSKVLVPVLIAVVVDGMEVPAHAYAELDEDAEAEAAGGSPAKAVPTAAAQPAAPMQRFDACAAVEAVSGNASTTLAPRASSASTRAAEDVRIRPILDLLHATAPNTDQLRECVYLAMDEVARLVRSSPSVRTDVPLDADAPASPPPVPWSSGWLARGTACTTSARPLALGEAMLRHTPTLAMWCEAADDNSSLDYMQPRVWIDRRYARRFALAMEGLLVVKAPSSKDLVTLLPDASSDEAVSADNGASSHSAGDDANAGAAADGGGALAPAAAPAQERKATEGTTPTAQARLGVVSSANARFRRGIAVMQAAMAAVEQSHERIAATLCRSQPRFLFGVYLKNVLKTNKGHRRETPPGGLMERSALTSLYFVLLRALERQILAARKVLATEVERSNGAVPIKEWRRIVGALDPARRAPLLTYPSLDVWTSDFSAVLDMNRFGGGYAHLFREYAPCNLVKSPVLVCPVAGVTGTLYDGEHAAGGGGASGAETHLTSLASVEEWCERLSIRAEAPVRADDETTFTIPDDHAHACVDYVLLLYSVCMASTYKETSQLLQSYTNLHRQMDETRSRIARCADDEGADSAAALDVPDGGTESADTGSIFVDAARAAIAHPLSSNRMYADTLRRSLKTQEDELAEIRRACALRDVILYGKAKQSASLHALAYALQVLHATSATRGDVLRYAPDYWVEGSIDLFHALRRGDPPLPAMAELMEPSEGAPGGFSARFAAQPHLGTVNELTSFLTRHLDDKRILSPDTKDVFVQSLLVLLQYPDYVRAFETCSSSRTLLAPTLLRVFNEALWIPSMNAWLRLLYGSGFAQETPAGEEMAARSSMAVPWIAHALEHCGYHVGPVKAGQTGHKATHSSRHFQEQFRRLLLSDKAEYERVFGRILSSANWTATELSAAAREAEVASRRRAREAGLVASRASLAELQSHRRKCLIMLELTTSLLRMLEAVLLCAPNVFLGGTPDRPPATPSEMSVGRARIARVYETLSFALSRLMGANGERALREAQKSVTGGEDRERLRDALYAPIIGCLAALDAPSVATGDDGALNAIAELAELDAAAAAEGRGEGGDDGEGPRSNGEGPLLTGVRALLEHGFVSAQRSGELSDAELEAAQGSLMPSLRDALEAARQKDADAGEDDEVPDDLLDPLTASMMNDPIMLPSSKMVCDRATILRHLAGGNAFDPFSREPLQESDLVDAKETRAKLAAWRKQRTRK